jgi:hypothetical protein
VAGGTTGSTTPPLDTSHIGAVTIDGTASFSYVGQLAPADNLPPGADTLVPSTGTFVPLNDVMFRSVGADAYYSHATGAEGPNDFSYRRGAITLFSQSYGAMPCPLCCLDYDYGSPELASRSSLDALKLDDKGNLVGEYLYYVGQYDVVGGFRLKCTNPVSSATFDTAPGTISLYEDGVLVSTISSLAGSLRNQHDQFVASLPSGWVLSCHDPFYTSRAATAIKNGAAFSIGSFEEPYVSGAPKAGLMFEALVKGFNLLESVWASGIAMLYNRSNALYGDPMYKPYPDGCNRA